MADDYASRWIYWAMWAYLLAIVALLMTPTFYNYYISFNEFGFGAANYEFTLGWYGAVFQDAQLMTAFGWTILLAAHQPCHHRAAWPHWPPKRSSAIRNRRGWWR